MFESTSLAPATRSSSRRPTIHHRDSVSSASSNSSSSSLMSAINSVVFRQPSFLHLEEERRFCALGLELLEPRPTLHFVGFEERIAHAAELDAASAATSPSMSPTLSPSSLFRA